MQHAVGYVSGNEYYGAKASINVWAPKIESQYEFSLSQMWVIAGSFGEDLNTIEAGWQVCVVYLHNHFHTFLPKIITRFLKISFILIKFDFSTG